MSVSRWRKKFRKFLCNLDPALKTDRELAFALFLNDVARHRRAFATGPSGATGRATLKRDARRIQRKIAGQARNNPKRFTVTDPDILSYRFREDYLRDELNPKFGGEFIGIPQRIKNKIGAHVKLKNLSFMSDPGETLKQLRGIRVGTSVNTFASKRKAFLLVDAEAHAKGAQGGASLYAKKGRACARPLR